MSLIICSHRGPIAHVRSDGRIERRPAGPGGLVAAVGPALRQSGGTWMFAPATEGDRELARSNSTLTSADGVDLVIVDLPRRDHRDHYEVISTQLLSPLFHYLLPLASWDGLGHDFARAWHGYLAVNRAYAKRLRGLDPARPILIEDLFLLCLGAAVRRTGAPGRRMSYFHHVPWCEPDYFGVLGEPLRRELLEAMLAYDSVGFHCRRWAEAFLGCCERFVPDAAIDDDAVQWQGRRTRLLISPAPIHAASLAALRETESTARWRDKFEALTRERSVIARVERADPQKNAVRGLRAYELLLQRRSELARSTVLLAVMTPVRGWIPAYREYLRRCETIADRINRRFGAGSSGPVLMHVAPDPQGDDHHRAIAALTLARTLVVDPVFDGLNLVALEGVVVGEPAVVLSENAGVHDQLGAYAYSVSPWDEVRMAGALEDALDAHDDERQRRAAEMRRIATARTPSDWVGDRLRSIGCG